MSSPRVRPRSETGKVAGENSYELRNYRLYERIGQDELATIYRAAHLTLGRPVHVHLLRRTDWVSVSRFQLAGRLAAQFSHPGLLPVVDAGHDDRYGYYLVTPQLEARSLATILAEGPLEPVMALKIGAQIAATLDHLHSQGVVHRDLQPANILVNQQGVAYLTNLSLAASPDTPDLSSVDEADYLTPYSAPEQKLDKGDAAATLDIYSLGALLYHMLGGQAPPPPGQPLPSLAARDPALSSADRAIQRMMAPQPAQRFQTASAGVGAVRQSLRSLIDLATEDMEESRWETSAEWLENPLETVLGDALDEKAKDFLARSRRRADEMHRRDAVRRLLNRWSRSGFFRRRALGQLIQPEQIVSYNVYYYELRVAYETRTKPETRQRPHQADDRNATLPPPDLWAAPVPENDPFIGMKPQTLVLPNSTRLLDCPDCVGGKVTCKECKGKGTVERIRKVRNPDNSTNEERLTGACPSCQGYGKIKCPRCDGIGKLVEEQVFSWSRRAKLWQSTDDFDDLPRLVIQRCLEPIHHATIDPYDGHWHSVAPIATILRTAIGEVTPESRIAAAELTISGAPITEIEYSLEEKPNRLHLIGFNNELVGNWALLNPERIALAAIAGILALIALLVILVTVLF